MPSVNGLLGSQSGVEPTLVTALGRDLGLLQG